MNKIILSLCLVLIALMGIASVSACDVDNCTTNGIALYDVDGCGVDNCSLNGTAPFDVDGCGVDNCSLNGTASFDEGGDNCSVKGTALNDVDESGVDNSSADDAFPYNLEEYYIDNCPTDGKTPYNVYEHVCFDEDYNPWVDPDLYHFAGEVIMNFNDEASVEIFMHELGISERDAWWLYFVVIDYYHIVEEIAPPDEYDRMIYYDPWK